MAFREISSLQHPLVKHLVKLRETRSYRYENRRVVISGLKLIEELAAQFHFRTLLVENGTSPSFNFKADEIFSVPPQILKKVTGLESPESIAVEIEMPAHSSLSSVQHLLILDGVSDPGNLGTLLRTAKALGWEGAFLTQGSTDPFNEKALRAAKGATFTLPWRSGSWEELNTLLKEKKMTLFAAEAKGNDVASLKAQPPFALALGNEANGLTPSLKEASQLIAIPMQDRMESLNVASAGSILMYVLKSHQ